MYIYSYSAAGYNKLLPPPTGVEESFDIYVDQVRFIPDVASIIKINGRFLHEGRQRFDYYTCTM